MRDFQKRMEPAVEKILHSDTNARAERIREWQDLIDFIQRISTERLKPIYVQWIVSQYTIVKDLDAIEDTIPYMVDYQRLRERKRLVPEDALQNIRNRKDLMRLVKSYDLSRKERNLILEQRLFDEDQAGIVYEDSKVKVLRIFTEAASCHFGKGTKWCISGKNNAFKNYSKHHDIFFILFKRTAKKWAVVMGRRGINSIWNELNEQPSISDILSARDKYPKLAKVFPDDIRFNKSITDVEAIQRTIDTELWGTSIDDVDLPSLARLVPKHMLPRMWGQWKNVLGTPPEGREWFRRYLRRLGIFSFEFQGRTMNTDAKRRLGNQEIAVRMRDFQKRTQDDLVNRLYQDSWALDQVKGRMVISDERLYRRFLDYVQSQAESYGNYHIDEGIDEDRLDTRSLQWLISRYVEGGTFRDILDSIKLLLEFQGRKKLKQVSANIQRIRDIDTLRNLLETRTPSKREKKQSTEKNLLATKQVNVMYDSAALKVVEVFSKDAAMYYGKGTIWCTAAKCRNLFAQYKREGYSMYYIIFKGKRGGKWAIAWKPGDTEVVDQNNVQRGLEDIRKASKEYPVLSRLFRGSMLFNPDISTRLFLPRWKKVYKDPGNRQIEQELDLLEPRRYVEIIEDALEIGIGFGVSVLQALWRNGWLRSQRGKPWIAALDEKYPEANVSYWV